MGTQLPFENWQCGISQVKPLSKMKWDCLKSYGKRIMLLKDHEVIILFKYVFYNFLGFILICGFVGKFLG